MEPFLTWLHDLPISVWVAQAETIWAFPFILFLHTTGIALTAGCSFIVSMALLGWIAPVSPQSLRRLLSWFWAGFVLNAVSGTLLFLAAATVTGYKPTYYLKLVLIVLGVAAFVPIASFVRDDVTTASSIPVRLKTLAAASLLSWAAVIATGRLIAYL